jgi:hypothetical protein
VLLGAVAFVLLIVLGKMEAKDWIIAAFAFSSLLVSTHQYLKGPTYSQRSVAQESRRLAWEELRAAEQDMSDAQRNYHLVRAQVYAQAGNLW